MAGNKTIGITMGDAAGIGPEVVLKALAAGEIDGDVVVIGDLHCLERTAINLSLAVNLRAHDPNSKTRDGCIAVADLSNLSREYPVGIDNAETGRASAEYVVAAVDMWRRGEIDAVATAPISKRAISLAGYDYPGHTEFLAHLTGTERFAMSFFGGRLRIVLLSTHLSLRSALDMVKRDRLVDLTEFSSRELSRLLGRPVSIAMAGLNPHASEGGMFGTEEEDEIEPAVVYCREDLGLDVSGPFSPDTVFVRASRGEFDAVIALYHDQATIPVKALAFGSAVNVTLGLPLVRTSVDHGTAYDIAGRGIADASSMKAAVSLAAELANSSQRSQLI